MSQRVAIKDGFRPPHSGELHRINEVVESYHSKSFARCPQNWQLALENETSVVCSELVAFSFVELVSTCGI